MICTFLYVVLLCLIEAGSFKTLHGQRQLAPSCLRSLIDSTEVQPPGPSDDQNDMKTFYIETYGCAMNLADSEIVRSVLHSAGYEPGDVLEEADLILTNTCAIRENAEAKIWHRLKYFESLRKKNNKSKVKPSGYPKIGVLGCMAERLKDKLLENSGVNFIAGPDAYRDLPNLLQIASTDQQAANTVLSLEETYADITPVREAEGNTHAFVSITRGCNNKCTFCIVPYTRGTERSRPVSSILKEVEDLKAQGYAEIVLLGQNVNSYYYTDTSTSLLLSALEDNDKDNEEKKEKEKGKGKEKVVRDVSLADGFSQKWTPKPLESSVISQGTSFASLLKQVAAAAGPEIRIRFQAPHPKDFPDEVLHLIAETPNICNSLHMPAQSGSTTVLDRMHRGYSREAYYSLIDRARKIIASDTPHCIGLGISSDFISGFCGETHDEHLDTLTMLKEVAFDQAFTYSYSRREQTYAGLFYQDDVSDDVKALRLSELIDAFQSTAQQKNEEREIGRLHIVLVEGAGNKVDKITGQSTLTGRTDSNKRVIMNDPEMVLDSLTQLEVPLFYGRSDHSHDYDSMQIAIKQCNRDRANKTSLIKEVQKGDYVIVKITSNRGHTLRGEVVCKTTNAWATALQLDQQTEK